MLNAKECSGERHEFGGDGRIIIAQAERIADALIRDYGGRVKLIYIDPPFGTGGSFEFKDKTAVAAYSDAARREEYMSMMRRVLVCCRELLSPDGSIYVHIDYRMSGCIRTLMDELFGEDNLMNEIIWSYKSGGRAIRHFSRKHDTILLYRKSKSVYFNIMAAGIPRGNVRRNHMKRRVDEDGRIYYAIKSGGKEYRYYEDDLIFPSDVWDDIEHLHQRDPERTGYATQKPEALLRRIISVSSEPGDLVMDLFSGSGTTAAVAQKLGRRYAVVDCGSASLLVQRRRMLSIEPNHEFFTEPKSFCIDYVNAPWHLEPEEAENLIEMQPTDGGHVVAVRTEGENRCSYAAAGRMDGGVFNADSYIIKPMRAESLFVPYGATLHLTDGKCRQGFFEIQV